MDDPPEQSEIQDQPGQPPKNEDSDSGRCHWCGYELRGLPNRGVCPECGKDYTPQSSGKLQPWPSVLMICLRLGWPIVGLVVSIAFFSVEEVVAVIFGYLFLLAVPFNTYFTVRSMLKRSMPEQTRKTGSVAVLRALGTTVCVIFAIVFLIPLIVAGCLLITESL